MNETPTSNNVAPAATPAANAPATSADFNEPAELNNVDEIAAALGGDDEEPSTAPNAGEENKRDNVPAAKKPEEATAPGVQDKTQPEQALPEPAMPAGWEEKLWQSMAPEARARVSAQIQEHAKALAAEKAAKQQLIQQNEQFATASNAQMQQSLMMMRQVMEGEFAAVDWEQLANEDPARYVQLQRAFQTRMGAINEMQRRISAQVAAINQRRAQAYDRETEAEYQRVLPEVKALLGAGYNPKTFAQETAAYLKAQGVPAEAINNISRGYELKLALKAMLYDKMQAARAQAAKKVAEAPGVSSPGSAREDDGGKLRSARARLANDPNSTEALANVLDLM